ncbi:MULTISPECIES: 16S rRNA (adenine(1518)-N(6)/adenine(1519)-N(6))-dimethyltransferase RsmA [unclassified Picosynechococcus]|uniref:16S rRNA (adenine(1518)-N(6)/adenine(1519)-N(6))- dimethyltransferase RsmA n=1 Tax=unclassified Picosynechococcus TaxID=3079910 RepID=UPI0009FB1BFD|nr:MULTISPECIES: 16S rRNA (adenine(1518)-N(6)/adenine(1519)-N(6))-dimethyltransferase RsmA [unclassified Picosynechococcus]QCS49495.1 16S rRNA (adenine(1518)-N(6)/adenine(1519)-N(6))-dimethyltransferase RsmA [Picosynechococcus sp. PCC 11901]
MRPRKRFGQHWLTDQRILDEIVAAANLQPTDRVLEIGPGKGALTSRLLPQVEALLSVEIDRDLCKYMVKNYGDRPNFLLLEADYLQADINEFLGDFPQFQNPRKVVANIPYNITGPILEKLLGTIDRPNSNPFESIVLLIQKEVGDRLVAHPCTKAFGALTLRVQYLADCETVCVVPPKAFYPKPKVESVVVRLRPRPLAQPAQNPKLLATLIKVGFASKRKMLRNNLKSLYNPEILDPIFADLDISPQARGEEVDLLQWIALSDRLNDYPKE